jgi:predicted signal transduction protein with EAL and GGDEF domain
MGEGLCMFDAEKRLSYAMTVMPECITLPPELLQPGTPHRESSTPYYQRHPERRDQRQRRKAGALDPERAPDRRYGKPVDELSDGRLICVTRQPMPGGGWVATHLDVTEQRRTEAKITHMAQHDALTDLPNRVLLRERLNHALAITRREAPAWRC